MAKPKKKPFRRSKNSNTRASHSIYTNFTYTSSPLYFLILGMTCNLYKDKQNSNYLKIQSLFKHLLDQESNSGPSEPTKAIHGNN